MPINKKNPSIYSENTLMSHKNSDKNWKDELKTSYLCHMCFCMPCTSALHASLARRLCIPLDLKAKKQALN